MADHTKALRRAVERYERAHEGRDTAIRRAHDAGMPYRAIAAVVGLSFARVAQIVRGPSL